MDNKTFSNDYSFDSRNNCKIDMVMSGKYLAERNFNIDIDEYLIDEYPKVDRIDYLKNLISKKYNKSIDNFVIGAASNGIIQNLVKLLFCKGGNLITAEFSFEQPEYAVRRLGGQIKKINNNNDFTINFENILDAVDNNTKAIFLCNPNNPTGFYYEPNVLIEFANKVKIPVIISEAAIEFTKKASLLDYDLPENIIVTRTFSKAYGLAGLRIGFAYLQGKLLDMYISGITRFEVSLLSIEVAINMLEKKDIDNNVNLVIEERNYLQEELKKIGIETLPSESNAFMSRNSYDNDFFEILNKNNISVAKVDDRKTKKYYFRIAVQTHNINALFISVMNELKKQKKF